MRSNRTAAKDLRGKQPLRKAPCLL